MQILSQLTAFLEYHFYKLIIKFEIVESVLKSNIPNDKIDIHAYTPIRCDLLGNDTHVGYYLS